MLSLTPCFQHPFYQHPFASPFPFLNSPPLHNPSVPLPHFLSPPGDKAFAQFLADEIKEEKKIQKHKSLPKISGGWELEVHGTEAKLVRKIAGEK